MITTVCKISYGSQTVPPIVPAVQGDTGRAISFEIADFTPPAGATATYFILKPSGEAIYNSATITDNSILCELTAQSLAEAGENRMQVRVLHGEDIVTSFEVILMVRTFLGDDAIESGTEMNIFDQAVEQATEQFQENAEQIAEEVIESIPADYTALTEEVEQLNERLSDVKDDLGNLNNLNTDDKFNIVNAINEVNDHFLEPVADAVSDWLDDHPEATTTVEDWSLTYEKLVKGTLEFVTPEMFGAVGDGITDDSKAIQDALDSGFDVLFSNKTYLIGLNTLDEYTQSYVGVYVRSNTNIKMGHSTVLKAIPTSSGRYSIVYLYEVENVRIDGGNIEGERNNHIGLDGETGMGLEIRDSSNILVININIYDCWGEALYIGNDVQGKCDTNLTFINATFDNNRRNACALINVDNIRFYNCKFTNTNGGSFLCGIDAEANLPYQKVSNLTVDGCLFANNRYGLSLTKLGQSCGHSVIRNCLFTSNVQSCALQFGEDVSHPTSGVVFVNNVIITGNVTHAIRIGDKLSNGYKLAIDGVDIIATSRTAEQDSAFDGVIVNRTTTELESGEEIGNIYITNVSADFSGVTKPTWLITQNLKDKIVKIKLNMTSAKNCPVTYFPVNSSSEYRIEMPSENALEITDTFYRMGTSGVLMATNLILANTSQRQSVILGKDNGDLSQHYIFNKSGQNASIYYIGANGNQAEYLLADKSLICIRYDKTLNKHIYSVV